MINLRLEKYCENCPDFDVEQSTNYGTTADGQITCVEHIIRCQNRDKCKHIYNYLEQYKINEEN